MNTLNLPTSTELPVRLLVRFQQHYPDIEPQIVLQAPGRDLWVMAVITDQALITLDAVELNARTHFSLHSARYKQTVLHRPLPRWARYAAGVIVQMDQSMLSIPGINAVVSGDEPPGPRYEYTLGVLFAALLHTFHEAPYTHTQLIDITEKARRDYVEFVTTVM